LLAYCAPRGFGRRIGFSDRDQPQRERGTALARDSYLAINTLARLAQHLVQIDGFSQSVEPAQIAPTCPDNDVTPLIQHVRVSKTIMPTKSLPQSKRLSLGVALSERPITFPPPPADPGGCLAARMEHVIL
jgi:hypothetical protein